MGNDMGDDMGDVQCAMCNVQCAMCNAQCAMRNVQCAMCNVQCAMCNVQCAVRLGRRRRREATTTDAPPLPLPLSLLFFPRTSVNFLPPQPPPLGPAQASMELPLGRNGGVACPGGFKVLNLGKEKNKNGPYYEARITMAEMPHTPAAQPSPPNGTAARQRPTQPAALPVSTYTHTHNPHRPP